MGYNKYVIQASRFKPEYIDSMATHKDLLRLYLQSQGKKGTLRDTVRQARQESREQ